MSPSDHQARFRRRRSGDLMRTRAANTWTARAPPARRAGAGDRRGPAPAPSGWSGDRRTKGVSSSRVQRPGPQPVTPRSDPDREGWRRTDGLINHEIGSAPTAGRVDGTRKARKTRHESGNRSGQTDRRSLSWISCLSCSKNPAARRGGAVRETPSGGTGLPARSGRGTNDGRRPSVGRAEGGPAGRIMAKCLR